VKAPVAALLGVPSSVAVVAAVLAGPLVTLRGDAPGPERGRRPVPEVATGPLTGLVVYVSAGHGWLLHRVDHDGEPIAWGTQRPRTYGMLEDEWTAAFVADDLAPALEAAGATVIALRERDRNPVAVVREEAGAGASTFGIDEVVIDALASGGTALRLEPGGSATWVLEAPWDGHWYLYARWLEDETQDAEAIYTVRAGAEVRELVVDQRSHGGHWWPLGDACVAGGDTVEITLTGSGTAPLSADAVRLGGGTALVLLPFNYQIVQRPYAEVAMAHQLERLGGPESLGVYDCGNVVSDMRLRPHWASWASPQGEEAAFLSIHTNATDGREKARGLTVFYGLDTDPPTAPDPRSVLLAHAVERELYDSVAAGDPEFGRRGVLPGDFSEISPVHNALPSTLLEMGFHDDAEDARRLQTQQYRDAAAAGIVVGLAEWRAAVSGQPAAGRRER
jgi:N-acetylmuramoyl-L-alanine amidase